METPYTSHNSQLFLVRLWEGAANGAQAEWHGKVQHIISGEAHSFHDWPTLVDIFMEMLQLTQSGQHDVGAHHNVFSPDSGDEEHMR